MHELPESLHRLGPAAPAGGDQDYDEGVQDVRMADSLREVREVSMEALRQSALPHKGEGI